MKLDQVTSLADERVELFEFMGLDCYILIGKGKIRSKGCGVCYS
jgi:hypothetical protein